MENPNRRTMFHAGFLGGGALMAALAGCATAEPIPSTTTSQGQPAMTTGPNSKTLLVYFSRAGENYHDGGRRVLTKGNTEVLAGMISDRTACDVYRIEETNQYSNSYDETVARNADEQRNNSRPAIAKSLPNLGQYNTVLLGSPVWNVRAPMIMSTFLDGVDLAGKVVRPFVTYAVSGMGSVEQDYRARLTTAEVLPGLALRGEDLEAAGTELDHWLQQSGLGV